MKRCRCEVEPQQWGFLQHSSPPAQPALHLGHLEQGRQGSSLPPPGPKPLSPAQQPADCGSPCLWAAGQGRVGGESTELRLYVPTTGCTDYRVQGKSGLLLCLNPVFFYWSDPGLEGIILHQLNYADPSPLPSPQRLLGGMPQSTKCVFH